MEFFSIDLDNVISGYFLTGRMTYNYALDHLFALVDKLDIQRRFQNESFYKRLEIDFQKGCITPPITLAFIQDIDSNDIPNLKVMGDNILNQIASGFVLDGIQRLYTLKRVANTIGNTLDLNKYLYVNIIICPSRDNLLYRMVTLNNGQKPMTARHQIEILVDSIYDYSSYDFRVIAEKENLPTNTKGFKKADLLNAYISFLSNSVLLDNKKIIEDKLDELVARKIIESKLTNEVVDFNKILFLINRMSQSEVLYDWIKNGNNLMGFCVGLRTSYTQVMGLSNLDLEASINNFEGAFKSLNVSKIKLSRERRRLSAFFIANLSTLMLKNQDDLVLLLADHA